MAVEEINAKGGVLGRKLEVLFRDDKGQPAEAVKHAQELVESEKVALIAGGFLSNVGLAVSDWAKQNKTMYVAAEPLTEAITWSKGHDHAVRLRPNTYEQGRMLAEKAGKMKYVKWATIGPNYEYGKRAWETFRDRLKEMKPEVQMVGEHWPTLGKIEPGPLVTAIMSQNPTRSTSRCSAATGSPSCAKRRSAGSSRRCSWWASSSGEPEYIDPLGIEAPEGMLVTGYPWYDIKSPAHQDWVARYTKRGDKHAGAGLAHRLRHLPVRRRGDQEGREHGHGQARRRLQGAQGRDAHRAHHLPRRGRPVHHGRVGGHDQDRSRARRRASWSTTSTSPARRCCPPTTKRRSSAPG